MLGLSPKAAEKVKEIQSAETIDATYGLRLLTNGQWDYRFIFDGEGELAQRLKLRPAWTPVRLPALRRRRVAP